MDSRSTNFFCGGRRQSRTGKPLLSTTAWILLVKPPRDLPIAASRTSWGLAWAQRQPRNEPLSRATCLDKIRNRRYAYSYWRNRSTLGRQPGRGEGKLCCLKRS
jgi:hypothetical protein